MMKNIRWAVVVMSALTGFTRTGNAGLVEFWNDADGWQSTVKKFNFIAFTGFPAGTPITSQYAGITITSASIIHNAEGYSDGWGLWSPNGVTLKFDMPIHAFAVDHLGVVQFDLYLKGEHIATSSEFDYAVPQDPFFSGILSQVAFDEVYIFRPMPPFSSNVIALDNIYWSAVPAPSMLPVLALAMLTVRGRRRSPCRPPPAPTWFSPTGDTAPATPEAAPSSRSGTNSTIGTGTRQALFWFIRHIRGMRF